MMKKIILLITVLFAYGKMDASESHQPDGSKSPSTVTRNFSDGDIQQNYGNNTFQQINSSLVPWFFVDKNKVKLSAAAQSLKNKTMPLVSELEDIPSQVALEEQTNEKNIVGNQVITTNHSDEDDLEYFDAQEAPMATAVTKKIEQDSVLTQNEQLLLQNDILTPQDITAQDAYSGYDPGFDQLYQFAKRDLYLAQQNEKMFPSKQQSYETLKKYYVKLMQQRKEMAELKNFMGPQISKLLDNRRYDRFEINQNVRQKLVDIDNKRSYIYHNNVVRPRNAKSLIDYKIPLLQGVAPENQPQIQLNELDLLKAKIIVDQLQKSHMSS